MAQFTKYASTDAGAPQLSGTVGSLITVFDYILVTGQGWTHPQATAGNCASYQQAAASIADYSFQLNDAAPHGVALAAEAWMTGWKTCTAVTAPVGTGTGQFPTAAQLLTTGHVVLRKSETLDSVSRQWVAFADARTFYFFALTQSGLARYYSFGFGEFYSLYGNTDTNNCMIVGRNTVNSPTSGPVFGGMFRHTPPSITSGNQGLYIADNFAGSSGSVVGYQTGDFTRNNALMSSSAPGQTYAGLASPNLPDNAIYISPMLIHHSDWSIRGRMRGVYTWSHANTCAVDGAKIIGTGPYAGKTFTQLDQGGSQDFGSLLIETSNTLETN